VKCGEDITYKKSDQLRRKGSLHDKYYYQLSFNITFKEKTDLVFISYTYPYTFSKL
jgi:hypothetical protein